MTQKMILALVASALAGAWLGPGPSRAEPVTVVDGDGRRVAINDASRVLSLGGSVTETLYALGLEPRVIGVDTTSLFPADVLATKPNVGYLRALSAEGVLSLGPSLILAEHDAGPPEAVALLERASVPVVRLSGDNTAAGVVARLRLVGRSVGEAAKGDALADAVGADLAAVEREVAGLPRVRAVFVLSLADGRVMAAGANTAADAMLALAGAQNALTGFSGYKPVDAEALLAAAPEAIVVIAKRGNGPGPGIAVADVLADPTLGRTPAAKAGRVVAMDGLYLLGFGPRAPQAAHDLAAALHPDASLKPLPDRPWAK